VIAALPHGWRISYTRVRVLEVGLEDVGMNSPAGLDAREPDPEKVGEPSRPVLGSLLLAFGAGLFGLGMIEQLAGLPFWMPRSWFSDRPLWYFVAMACVIGGAVLLRNRQPPRDWRPSTSRRFQRVVMYTREGCHLCDQARDTLLRYGDYLPPLEEVDVDGDPELRTAYGECVPVVEIDGKVRFRGSVNEVLLRRLIENA
jgi:glutaredoxin